MSVDTDITMLDELEGILEAQISLARRGKIGDVERLSEQAGCLVKKMAQEGISESVEFRPRQEKLQELYRRLVLIVTAAKAQAAEQLQQVGQGRKMLETYRRSI